MGQMLRDQLLADKELIEMYPAPIVHFDGFGPIVIDSGRMWWPLYRRVPNIQRAGHFDLVLQAWTVTRLDLVSGTMQQTRVALGTVASPSLTPRLVM